MSLVNEHAPPAEFTPSPLPAWVRMLDGLTLLMLGATVMLVVGDGVRLEIGTVRLSITSALRAAAWTALLIAIRHALYRAPALPSRVLIWSAADP